MILQQYRIWSLVGIVAISAPTLLTASDKVHLIAGATPGDLNVPFAAVLSPDGNLYIAEYGGHRVLKVDAKGKLTTFAGSGKKGSGGDGGPALKAEFNDMHTLAVAPNGDLFIADTLNHKIRKIDIKSGEISTFAGLGEKGLAGDGGPATKAKFDGVYCIAFGPKAEQLYIDDLENRRIRAIDMKTGEVSTVAGNGKKGVPDDGATAKDAPLVDPRAVAADSKGNVYILERSGNALRVVNPDGKIRTVAGTGKAGHSGDGGDALKAQLNGPKHLCIDPDDNVVIADTENHVIRKYLPKTGMIVHVAGTGKLGAAGVDGPPEKCQLARPHGVWAPRRGEIYIADSENNRVLLIRAD